MISAYCILHRDDNFLENALQSIDRYVDEIVIVDGAYEWVAPFFQNAGIDPVSSGETTMAILAKFGSKIKYYSGTWRDELHKREFGYSMCSGDVVLRIDADEIFEIDDGKLKRFLDSNYAVVEMKFPLMMTDKYHRQQNGRDTIPCQAFLFKKSHINAEQHCGYLWLVLTDEEEQRRSKPNWALLQPDPIAKVAHISCFRVPSTGVNRARFYCLLSTRKSGMIPWEHNVKPETFDPNERVSDIFKFMSAAEYTSFLKGHGIVSGFGNMDGFHLEKVTFAAPISAIVTKAYETCLDEVDIVRMLQDERVVVNGMHGEYDLTRCLQRGQLKLRLTCDTPVTAALASSISLLKTKSPKQAPVEKTDISVVFQDRFIDLDFNMLTSLNAYRYTLMLSLFFDSAVEKGKIVACEIRP